MTRRTWVAAATFLLAFSALGALPSGTYPFRTYGVESGLGNLSAVRIAQDRLGFLWVATQDGIYRYDGNRFRRFGLEEGLPSTSVTTVHPGSRGELWAATVAGVVRWDGTRFRVIASLPRANVNTLASDARGRLWVATQQGLFAGTGDAFARVGSWDGPATAVWCDPRNADVWIAATGVIARQNASGTTRWNVAPRERIDSVVVDAQSRVWARSGNHLWSMHRDGSDLRDESAALPATSNNGYLSLDARGDLWVPTDRGLAIHDVSGWRVIGPAQGLPTDWARDVFEDREGSIWVASLGVHRMLGRGELVSYKRASGLPNEVTWCFHWDREGRLLVGTDLGLARSGDSGWTVVEGTEGMQIRSIVEEENGVLWAAGSPAQVLRIDGKDVRRYDVNARAVLRLARDREGSIWAATRGGGLLRMRAAESRFTRVELPGGDAEEDLRGVLEDRRGRIWATGQHGLARFDGTRWKRFTTKDGLRHGHVSYIMESSFGDLWVPYFEPLGIARIRAEGDAIRIVETIPTSKVFLIGEDQRGRLWIGGGTGVDIVSGGRTEHLSTSDGLAGDDTDAMAFLCDTRGDVFIGTSSGFSHYSARGDAPRRDPPVVVLTNATLGRNRDFAATFSALSFFKPDIIEYEVRLAGLEDAFQRVTEPRAHWSPLPPGEYRFEARARLRPGPWSRPAAVAFSIRPAWWQTLWARIAAIALLAALAWLAYRWRVALLRRRNLELQALVEQRTRELAELSVTDALTGMKNRRYLQLSMPGFASETLQTNGDLLCFLLDLDHFKDVNDRHGHRIGDEVLVSLSALLGTHKREGDTLVRWGGEELLYIARHASRRDAMVIAEGIRAAVEAHELRASSGVVIRLTCSIGFAAYPFLPADPQRVTWEEVVDLADLCLYAAKRAGRNCSVGVIARDSVASETLVRRMRESFETVIASGEVELLSSRPVGIGLTTRGALLPAGRPVSRA